MSDSYDRGGGYFQSGHDRGSQPGSRISPKSAREALQPERVPPPPPRSEAVRHPLVVFLNFLLTVAVIGLVTAIAVTGYAFYKFDQGGPLEQARTIMVSRGMTLDNVAEQLRRQSIISNRWIFMAGTRFSGSQNDIKAGEYLIDARASMRDVLDTLVSGRSILYSVTIPEGFTSAQIVDRLLANEELTGNIEEIPPEGTLLPDTYKFTRDDTRQNLVNRMRQERDQVLVDIWDRRDPDLPIADINELVILASIVEKETGIADERTRVAAVFINRLRRNMRLESDPTILYGLYGGESWRQPRTITASQKLAANEYNTYQITGLPPGPIANPGRAALEAVANPSRTDDLFFVADGTGGHVFAETYEAHLRNVERWRQIEARRRREAAEAEAAEAAPEVDEAAGDGAPVEGPAGQ
jgi:UPF0755 protein